MHGEVSNGEKWTGHYNYSWNDLIILNRPNMLKCIFIALQNKQKSDIVVGSWLYSLQFWLGPDKVFNFYSMVNHNKKRFHYTILSLFLSWSLGFKARQAKTAA